MNKAFEPFGYEAKLNAEEVVSNELPLYWRGWGIFRIRIIFQLPLLRKKHYSIMKIHQHPMGQFFDN